MLPDKVCVLGAGSWGTALAILLCKNIDRVFLWGRDTQSLKAMQAKRCNERYLPKAQFPQNLEIQTDFEQIIDQQLNFVIVVPSCAFRAALIALNPLSANKGWIRVKPL